MANITQYRVLFYGAPDGYHGNRAQVSLFEDGECVGYVRFRDPGMPLPADGYLPNGQLVTHMPSTMVDAVIDLLRNEKPITFYFGLNRCFLGTGSSEPVGEGE